ncbi:DUF4350 domain-containing protein [Cohnella terricola]|uniref:DUF4350 domain-containing protein n=1 Tax=Cohnella terricola TaxID=1289167 RepID=A0A559JIW3_9BACL|nr:DUF4350 domain-containing protein [Cohnella terricola]TVX99815.1 DUF4350 domain-containing protein [Cohnella terricola]
MASMQHLLNRNKHVIGLAACVMLFIGLGLMIAKPEPERMAPYVSYSADVDGTKGIIELLEEKRVPIKPWKRSWRELPSGKGHALLVIEPGGAFEDEWTKLLEWVGRGNELLLFSHELDEGGAFLTESSSASPGVTTVMRQEGEEMPEFQAEVGTRQRIVPEDGVSELLIRDSNGMIAARRTYGDGAIIAAVTPEWLTNENVLKHDHFELVWPWMAGDSSRTAMWVDEYHHGYEDSRGFLAAYPAWLVAACAGLAVALLLWLWQRGKRFGPTYTPRAWTVRRGDETLRAVAAWYERRRFKSAALAHQARALRQLLLTRWGLPPEASLEDAMLLAKDRLSVAQAVKLERLLRHAQAMERGEAAEGAFVERTREYGEMIALLEKE